MSASKAMTAAIFGVSGHTLTADERAFFTETNPYGYILFARNCDTPAQIKALTDSLRELSGRKDLPILIDQEGGRVARLKPPHFPLFPAAARFAELYAVNQQAALKATFVNARLIAHELYQLGITVDCAPVADLPVPGAHDVIGDRAFGSTAQQVVALARAMAEGLTAGGVVPVLKHIPGHGRAGADSHLQLPTVTTSLDELERTDFVAFKALSDLPMAMTAHVLFTALDDKRMTTVSPAAIAYIRNKIGYQGLLMSDDLSMKAMEGDFTQRTQDALRAGCDVVLHCNGEMPEMRAVAKGLHTLSGVSLERATKAAGAASAVQIADVSALTNERDALLRSV